MYKSDQLSCYKLVLTVRGVQLYLSRRRLTFFSYRPLGPQNPPETIDFTDPGGMNFHSPPPRLRLWSLYLYMSFYTSDHNRRKALRIPDIMVCISREQYNRSPTASPVQILNHRFKVRNAWDFNQWFKIWTRGRKFSDLSNSLNSVHGNILCYTSLGTQINHIHFRRLPALGRFYRETKF